jgi:uncharacterized protein YbjQ (UPF0145 family)
MSLWNTLKQRAESVAQDARHAVDGLTASAHTLAAPRALSADELARQQAWAEVLPGNDLPEFVKARLAATARRELPWVSTATPAEMLAQRIHGIEPLGMVNGNCWYHFDYSWSDGHYDGWHHALDRLRLEAALLGANAVVDVTLQAHAGQGPNDVDFALTGTAVRIRGLPPSTDPAVATVSALHFVRLLDDGAVPVGIAIGAHFDWYLPRVSAYGAGFGMMSGAPFGASAQTAYQAGALWSNVELSELSAFQQHVRLSAIEHLRSDGQRLNASVLAHTEYSELTREEGDGGEPPRFQCRYIAIGTAVAYEPNRPLRSRVCPTFSLADRQLEAPRSQP